MSSWPHVADLEAQILNTCYSCSDKNNSDPSRLISYPSEILIRALGESIVNIISCRRGMTAVLSLYKQCQP